MTNSAIVLCIDRLGTTCLGPYGNTWVPTPNFDALAARSLVLENMLADAPQLQAAYRAFFTGRHAMESDGTKQSDAVLRQIQQAGAKASLITDDPNVAALLASEVFDDILLVSEDSPSESAAGIDETATAHLFAEAIDALSQQQEPFLLWVHARGFSAPWDAPLELRQALAHEEDPDPLETVSVPSLQLDEDYDPDQLLGIVQAYAAQVMALDACLGALMNSVEQHSLRDQLLTIVTSPRGFPLGEHRAVGEALEVLYGELLRIPCFLWRGDREGALLRSHALAQTPDVAATLLDWFGRAEDSTSSVAQSLLSLTDHQPWQRDRVLSVLGAEHSLRTPAWFLRQPAGDDTSKAAGGICELFRKPDDRWEVNELSRRCPQIVEQLVAVAEEYAQALRGETTERLPPLDEELIEGID